MSEDDPLKGGTTVIKMQDHKVTALYRWPSNEETYWPKPSEWKCYLFHKPNAGFGGIVWHPQEGAVPNRFVRWMSKVFFGCTWVKVSK
jgi:hypothetical protein